MYWLSTVADQRTPKLSYLEQQTFIISHALWAEDPGMALLGACGSRTHGVIVKMSARAAGI